MTDKLFNRLMLFCLFGISMWFFGNLYEAVVVGPNMLNDSIPKLHHFQGFFTLTNPAMFYVPIPPIAAIVLVLLFLKTPTQNSSLKALLKRSIVFQLIAYALSVYIIIQLNFKLFFGDLEKYSTEIHSDAVQWNILNICRVVLVGISLVFVFKAYLQSLTYRDM